MTLTENDLADAILGEIEDGSIKGDKLARVGDAALNELLRRLEDPESAKDLPGTGLLNIANAYVKARERELAKPQDKTTPDVDAVDVILNSNLPSDKKRELLNEELARGEQRQQHIRQLLTEGIE